MFLGQCLRASRSHSPPPHQYSSQWPEPRLLYGCGHFFFSKFPRPQSLVILSGREIKCSWHKSPSCPPLSSCSSSGKSHCRLQSPPSKPPFGFPVITLVSFFQDLIYKPGRNPTGGALSAGPSFIFLSRRASPSVPAPAPLIHHRVPPAPLLISSPPTARSPLRSPDEGFHATGECPSATIHHYPPLPSTTVKYLTAPPPPRPCTLIF